MRKFLSKDEYFKATGEECPYPKVFLVSEKAYKTDLQNRLFHGLLTCFYKSGVSSFDSFENMRDHYKIIAGLSKEEWQTNHLTEDTRKMLWRAIRILPLTDEQRLETIRLLQGRQIRLYSWADATKEQARTALDCLIKDMEFANVYDSPEGKHFIEIRQRLGLIDD